MGDLRKDFSRREFACRCCGAYVHSDALLDLLQTIRDAIGHPIKIISGTRCKKHNAEVGGVANSAHLTGEGADIQVDTMSNRSLGRIVKRLHSQGLLPQLTYCYMIRGSRSLHVGVDAKPRRSIWGTGFLDVYCFLVISISQSLMIHLFMCIIIHIKEMRHED